MENDFFSALPFFLLRGMFSGEIHRHMNEYLSSLKSIYLFFLSPQIFFRNSVFPFRWDVLHMLRSQIILFSWKREPERAKCLLTVAHPSHGTPHSTQHRVYFSAGAMQWECNNEHEAWNFPIQAHPGVHVKHYVKKNKDVFLGLEQDSAKDISSIE